MNRNQKIALGCGGAGCLGLIVVVVAASLVYYFSQRRSTIISDDPTADNVNSNRNSNSNSNSDDSSSDVPTSMNEDDQHKLFHAASATRDSAVMNRVWRKLGLTDADGTPNDKYAEFTKDHIAWLFRNADFLQEIDTEQKARAYVDAHIND
jgi:hypothetical protein